MAASLNVEKIVSILTSHASPNQSVYFHRNTVLLTVLCPNINKILSNFRQQCRHNKVEVVFIFQCCTISDDKIDDFKSILGVDDNSAVIFFRRCCHLVSSNGYFFSMFRALREPGMNVHEAFVHSLSAAFIQELAPIYITKDSVYDPMNTMQVISVTPALSSVTIPPPQLLPSYDDNSMIIESTKSKISSTDIITPSLPSSMISSSSLPSSSSSSSSIDPSVSSLLSLSSPISKDVILCALRKKLTEYNQLRNLKIRCCARMCTASQGMQEAANNKEENEQENHALMMAKEQGRKLKKKLKNLRRRISEWRKQLRSFEPSGKIDFQFN